MSSRSSSAATWQQAVPHRGDPTAGDKPTPYRGTTVDTAIIQYVAYLDGRIQEVAIDRYAQADDGSVWYFGEDYSAFEDGKVTDTEGTWVVDDKTPAALIMPAHRGWVTCTVRRTSRR